MTQAEFERWQEFYAESPFDDHHRYHRPAMLVASSMAKHRYRDMMEFLVPPVSREYSQADLNTFRALGMEPPRQ